MSEFRTILEQTKERFPAPELPLERVLRVRDRRRRNQRLTAGVVALGVMLSAVLFGTSVLRSGRETPGEHTHHPIPNGLIALSNSTDTLTLLDPKTGNSSGLSLRMGSGGSEYVLGFAWSPDGTKFAYTTAQDWEPVRSYLYDLTTNTISTNVPCESDGACMSVAAWSPDGSRIALSGGGLDLIDPDGSNRRTLIESKERLDVGSVTWSPDGATIAFIGRHNAVYEIDADGSNLGVLLDLSGSGSYLQDLSWSPDGSRIAYVVYVPQTPVGGPGTPSYTANIPQVWIVESDGAGPSKLFEAGECCGHYRRDTWTGLSWSGDGTMIAFVGNEPGTPGAGSDTGETNTGSRLYGIDADDGSMQVLARDVCLCGPPEWQPAP